MEVGDVWVFEDESVEDVMVVLVTKRHSNGAASLYILSTVIETGFWSPGTTVIYKISPPSPFWRKL